GLVEAGFAQRLGDDGKGGRRRGQVVQAVAARTPLPVELLEDRAQLLERLRRGVVAGDIAKAAGEGVPHVLGVVAAAARVLDRGPHALAEILVVHLCAGYPDHREPSWKQAAEGEPFYGGHELAAREVARGPEDDEHGRGCDAVGGRLDQRVLR